MRGAALLLGAGLALIGLGARAEAQPPEAERLYHEGQQAYDDKRYDAALALWQRSYALSKRPGLLFNIAQAFRLRGEDGDCARAVGSYKKFLRLDSGTARHTAAEAFIDELAECAKATPAPEDEPTTADPPEDGTAQTPAGDPEAAPERRSGSAGRQADTEPVRSTGSSSGTALRVIGGIVAAGGVATAVVGVYAGAQARQLSGELTRECMNGCQWSNIAARDAEGRSAEQRQWILYGVGTGGLVVGVALYYLGARAAAPAVAVAPGAGGGGLVTWSGRW